jgi:hypothetical protein
MALEYRLTLAGTTPVDQVAERTLPDPAERPTGTAPLLSAALFERYGFNVTVRAGQNGYLDVESDQGSWEWEPESYVSVTFRMDKLADSNWNVVNMLMAVRRVLETGPEDAALVLNGDVLLLTRFDGTLVKHRRNTWWAAYVGATEAIPG